MTDASTPATSLLAAQIRQKVRERGIVLWIDADGQYTGFVDRLADFPYPIVPFRDSYLELLRGGGIACGLIRRRHRPQHPSLQNGQQLIGSLGMDRDSEALLLAKRWPQMLGSDPVGPAVPHHRQRAAEERHVLVLCVYQIVGVFEFVPQLLGRGIRVVHAPEQQFAP